MGKRTVWPGLSQTGRRNAKAALALGAVLLATIGCSYRLTNTAVIRPEGIRTVAVEAVYDTSRSVVPHELLWEALQDVVASSGHLRLAPQNSADAILRAHLKEAAIGAAGTLTETGIDRDPTAEESRTKAPRPDQFRTLSQAGEIRDQGTLRLVVEVELWSLRTRTLLHQQTYTRSSAFQALHATPAVTTRANDNLRYQEALAATFKAQSGAIAKQALQDILVR